VSSNDFDGPYSGPDGSRGADEQGAGTPPAGGQGAGGAGGQGAGNEGQGKGGRPSYPAPEGWDNDGFWRDSSIDSDYETGRQTPVRPADGPREAPGYSYWADGRGWESTPGAPGAAPGAPGVAPGAASGASGAWPGQAPNAPATSSFDPNARAAFLASAAGVPGAGNEPTGVYGGAPGFPGSYGGPAGPGPGGPAGYGLGAPVGPGAPGAPGGPTGPGGPSRPGGPSGPAGPGGHRGKRKGSWWRHWTWKKALAVVGGTCVFFILCLFSAYEYLYNTTQIPAALASATSQNSIVYYSDGTTEIGTIGTTNRHDLALSAIPGALQNAFLAAEDKNFWSEGGISPTGIARAAYYDLTNSGSLNGGSTITQEFVRNYYDDVGLQQTASRKIKEILIAEKLSKEKSKQWILDNYLNVVQEGDNSYGVAAAAETYFGLPVSKLTVSEDAIIAGIPQLPSIYPLQQNEALLKTRWQYVLGQMVKDKFITQAQMNAAKFPTLLTYKDPARAEMASNLNPADGNPWDPYILDVVRNELTDTDPGADNVSVQQLETGGLKIVTSISLSMEREIYNAVDTTMTSANIESTGDNTVDSLPLWALVGAEVQDPKTGAIVAMYPGRGETGMSTKDCVLNDCDDNTAVYTREQVGSSFKPYVLTAAVLQGMNVGTSTLDTSPYLCVTPDSTAYSTPITGGEYAVDSPSTSGTSGSCLLPDGATDGFPVENDGGELIGKQVSKESSGAAVYSSNVQNALAMSSNTGFTDLAHKVGGTDIVQAAGDYGVDLDTYADGGSGLPSYEGDVGMALGIAPMTVNEQTSMLATIDDSGMYHTAHIVKYWQTQADGSKIGPKITSHQVLTPAQDSEVEYAMDETTTVGTAEGSVTLDRPLISKTGTTSDSHSGFFIGAIPQYAMVVGMFTSSQDTNTSDNLAELGGGGFGGYWPAKIWNTFALAEFNQLPVENLPTPQFSGATWNLLGPLPKQKPTVSCTVDGKKVKISGKTCPAPTPTPTCSYTGEGKFTPCVTASASAQPTPTCSYTGESQFQDCVTASASAQPTPTCSYTGESQYQDCVTASPSASASATCTPTGVVSGCDGTTTGTSHPTATGPQAGLAVGGVLAVLPGSLLWVTVSQRRRRRRRRTGKAE
jgi:membrane peptidoglycan carboxypeptidase